MTRPYGRRGSGYSFPEEERSFSLISFHSLQSRKKWSPPQLWHCTFPSSSPLGLLSTRARAALALLRLLSHDLDHLDGPPRRAPSTCTTFPFFWFFKLFGSFARRLGPVSSTINLQTLGHGNGSLQISLHVGPDVLLQVRLQSRKEGMEGLLISHSRKPILQLLEFLDVARDSASLPQCS